MRFLADENFRLDVVKWLKLQGHDVNWAASRLPDKTLANLAKTENRILLTIDSDFAMTLMFPPRRYNGVLIFRIHPPSFEKFKKALMDFFVHRNEIEINGKTFIIEEDSFLEIE